MFCSETDRKVKIFVHFGCNIAQIHSYCLESIYELQFSSITRYSKLDFLWTLNGPLKLMKMARFIPNQVIRKASPQHDTTIPAVCRVMITVSFSYTVCSMESKKVSLVLVWLHHILPHVWWFTYIVVNYKQGLWVYFNCDFFPARFVASTTGSTVNKFSHTSCEPLQPLQSDHGPFGCLFQLKVSNLTRF